MMCESGMEVEWPTTTKAVSVANYYKKFLIPKYLFLNWFSLPHHPKKYETSLYSYLVFTRAQLIPNNAQRSKVGDSFQFL